MNAYKEVKQDIKRTISIGLSNGILVNPKDPKATDISITSKHSFIDKCDNYSESYQHDYELGNYLFAMNDGSYFQIHYDFINKSKNTSYIKQSSLCFLPGLNQETGQPIHSYLRLDYDSEGKNSFFHPQAHLHVGIGNDLRIPVDNILLFSDFFEFVLYLFYHDYLKKWNKKLIIGHTLTLGEEGLTKYKVLADELTSYFFLHQKEKSTSTIL